LSLHSLPSHDNCCLDHDLIFINLKTRFLNESFTRLIFLGLSNRTREAHLGGGGGVRPPRQIPEYAPEFTDPFVSVFIFSLLFFDIIHVFIELTCCFFFLVRRLYLRNVFYRRCSVHRNWVFVKNSNFLSLYLFNQMM